MLGGLTLFFILYCDCAGNKKCRLRIEVGLKLSAIYNVGPKMQPN